MHLLTGLLHVSRLVTDTDFMNVCSLRFARLCYTARQKFCYAFRHFLVAPEMRTGVKEEKSEMKVLFENLTAFSQR